MRQRLLILILSCLGALAPALAQAWWQEDWSYRKQITVDTTQEGAAITERVGRVPVLVRLHTGNFSFDGVKENGADLRFVLGDDETVLNHRIESFDALLGVAYIWVDVPEIQGGARQDIWMYYGNPQAPLPDSNQVFDADYAGVYHFDGAPGGSADDATAYNNDSTNPVPGTTTGVIAQAAQFSGEPLMLPASPSLAVTAGGVFSFSAWIKAPQAAGEQLLYARRQGGNALLIGIANGVPFVEVNGQRSERGQPLAADQWQHLAVTAGARGVTLYLNGRQAGQMAVALPAFNGVAALGGDVPGYRAGVAGGAEGANDSTGENAGEGNGEGATDAALADAGEGETPAALAPATGFTGAMDEVRLSRVERSPALLRASALSQGPESRLLVFGVDEEQSGFGFGALGFLLSSVPVDAWVIIGVLALMMVQTWVVMFQKFRQARRTDEANAEFRDAFAGVGTRLEVLADDRDLGERLAHSSLWRLYQVAVRELRVRREQGADTDRISSETLEAIRASMDAVRTNENRALGHRLGVLSNAIAGGPYIGLLGTVLGIMVVFLGTAMAGNVNINAVAPGMAAALLATAAGLFVAIPALFAYNRLNGRNREISSDMRVFLDEFVTRLAELRGAGSPHSPSVADDLPVGRRDALA